jgi:hypothetical protein
LHFIVRPSLRDRFLESTSVRLVNNWEGEQQVSGDACFTEINKICRRFSYFLSFCCQASSTKGKKSSRRMKSSATHSHSTGFSIFLVDISFAAPSPTSQFSFFSGNSFWNSSGKLFRSKAPENGDGQPTRVSTLRPPPLIAFS